LVSWSVGDFLNFPFVNVAFQATQRIYMEYTVMEIRLFFGASEANARHLMVKGLRSGTSFRLSHAIFGVSNFDP
jgi:hypothetical protein